MCAARAVHQGIGFPLADDRAGEDRLPRTDGGRQRLAGEGGLVHLQGAVAQQAGIGRHDLAQPQVHHIPRHQLPGRQRGPDAASAHAGLQGQPGLEGRHGVAGLVLLPEPHQGVGHQQGEDDPEIRPAPHQGREDHRQFDHPGDRSPAVAEQLQEPVDPPFRDRVGAVGGKPAQGLRLGEPLGGGLQHLLQPLEIEMLPVLYPRSSPRS